MADLILDRIKIKVKSERSANEFLQDSQQLEPFGVSKEHKAPNLVWFLKTSKNWKWDIGAHRDAQFIIFFKVYYVRHYSFSFQVWNDPENTDLAETAYRENRGSGREGVANPREREAVCWTKTYPCSPTRTWGCRTTANISTNDERKNKTNEGKRNIVVTRKDRKG